MISYDPRGMTWDQYNKLMEEQFASNQLGHMPETDWRTWVDDLRDAEQRWLDMIKDTELYWTPNIQNKTVRYYNQKKLSRGGSYKGHTKNRTKPAWNKGLKGAQEYTIERNAKIAESKTKHPLRKINCLVCGDPIETKSKSKKYCGYSCSNNKHKVVVYSVSKETTKTQ